MKNLLPYKIKFRFYKVYYQKTGFYCTIYEWFNMEKIVYSTGIFSKIGFELTFIKYKKQKKWN